MTVRGLSLALAGTILLAGCGGPGEPAPEASVTGKAPTPAETPAQPQRPPAVADYPVLSSKDCEEVAELYFDAITDRKFALAALVWNDPVVNAARLETAYYRYKMPQFDWQEPEVEGAAGSLFCTVKATLTDGDDRSRAAVEGSVVLKRVNDVPGATPDQLRWTIRSSTFVENPEDAPQG
ncbi:hypothetical protein [Altererythrobacter sp. Root672]|uniref:hypothetical protein n=1 Tax=Altererythrobacter sp. Root672 TaxID=1736584 RepID=UPI0006F5C601|nr:hypothetical protein [Altererythrobacter sp. Root672]KRA80711.1 hypothetical protein ASD76_16370 [Altererythrobacter sp. Root672]